VEILLFILFILIIIFMLFIICSCKISGKISRKEEEAYIPKHLDPKDLDDEIKWQDSLIYDDEFIKKGTEDEEK